MRVGTKTVLFGYHQFLIHPLFVAAAWWRLYGFPFDPRLWFAFFVHDLGYIGKHDIDGDDGRQHPFLGAHIMSIFDQPEYCDVDKAQMPADDMMREGWAMCGSGENGNYTLFFMRQRYVWADFTLYHSRFIADLYHCAPSKLCVADKLASAMTPRWLALVLMTLSGEFTHGGFKEDLSTFRQRWHALTRIKDANRKWAMEAAYPRTIHAPFTDAEYQTLFQWQVHGPAPHRCCGRVMGLRHEGLSCLHCGGRKLFVYRQPDNFKLEAK